MIGLEHDSSPNPSDRLRLYMNAYNETVLRTYIYSLSAYKI